MPCKVGTGVLSCLDRPRTLNQPGGTTSVGAVDSRSALHHCARSGSGVSFGRFIAGGGSGGGEGDEVDCAGLIVVFPESKAVGPSQCGASVLGVADIEVDAAPDVVANDRTLRAALLLRDSVGVTKHARHPKCLGVIAGGRHRENDPVQKQRVAKLRASLWAHTRIRNYLRFHFLRRVTYLCQHLSRRVADDRVAAMGQTAKTILVIPEVDHGRLKLAQELQASEQVVGHALGTVGVVGVAPRPGTQRGHVAEVPEVQDGLRVVGFAESEHCLNRSRVGKMSVRARYRHPPFPLASKCRHSAARRVKALS